MKGSYILLAITLLLSSPSYAEVSTGKPALMPWIVLTVITVSVVSIAVLWVVLRTRKFVTQISRRVPSNNNFSKYVELLNSREISLVLEARKSRRNGKNLPMKLVLLIASSLVSPAALAQAPEKNEALLGQPGILITITLLLIPLLVGVIFLISKVSRLINQYKNKEKEHEAQQLAEYLLNVNDSLIDPTLRNRKSYLENLDGNRDRELIQKVTRDSDIPFVAAKKKSSKRADTDPGTSRLILWYIGTAVFWLVLGTTVGEYLGIKFVNPDIDHQSWLSFGRLRPVHTNAVFWGWSSLAMLGLGYYVVPVVSNVPIASLKRGWLSLILINSAVLLGTVTLMAGVNNGGGEYREYVWPIMSLFGLGLIITLVNFIKTVARRATHEIYISNWYIISSIMFALVISFIAYWPTWQSGLGETIVQGYYMHQGVGMWFMLFTLGVVYYFLPQQLNKPIYSYSLGILAFWTQIIFYTVIGTHHFVFSSIPWSLQTVAIVGSMGMVIPVVAGTTNFLLTFNGDFGKITSSYTLPFFLVGIVFYFTGSLQGTAEAFRYTNLLWHFTDFTVAHSHITMYGIIAFLVWGGIYALVPELTGKEPSHPLVGAHFWIAFIGLLLYSVPLMIGGTLKGMMWIDGKPLIDSVVMMGPFWLWRAIGGTMMWLSHLLFAYNFYRMVANRATPDIKMMAMKKIAAANVLEKTTVAN